MKRLVAYGDSWTAGEGCNREIEDTLSMHDKLAFQKENSWVKFLSDEMNIKYENHGESASPNNKIFNKVISDIKDGKTTKNDLVIVMWSSSLRDTLPFLPNLGKPEWLSWSTKTLLYTPDRFFTSTKTENRYYDFFMEEYKSFFLENLYSNLYYSIINQNYIIFLQKYFERYKIKYVMCDGIEDMFIGISNEYDKTDLINPIPYWGFRKSTIENWLIQNSDESYWEYKEHWRDRAKQHPNIYGYKKISEELYKFITDIIL